MDLQSWKKCCSHEFLEVKSLQEFIMTKPSSDTQVIGSSERLDMEECMSRHLFREVKQKPLAERSCIREAVRASSTNKYPEESINETLHAESLHFNQQTSSYWSSSGQWDRNRPETLTYNLLSDLCVIHEVRIHPFRAFSQFGQHIYSAENIRIRLGHAIKSAPTPESPSGTQGPYVWTYESPEFAMKQVDSMQVFKLPRPVLCIGGVMQVEFLGRVQTKPVDNLYYIWMAIFGCVSEKTCEAHPVEYFRRCSVRIQYVSVVGRPLYGFKLHFFEGECKFTLEYYVHDMLLEPENMPYLSSCEGMATKFREFLGASSQPNLKPTSKRNLMLDVLDRIPRHPSPVSFLLTDNRSRSSSCHIGGGESQFRKYEGGHPLAECKSVPRRSLMLDIMGQIPSPHSESSAGNIRAPMGDTIAEA